MDPRATVTQQQLQLLSNAELLRLERRILGPNAERGFVDADALLVLREIQSRRLTVERAAPERGYGYPPGLPSAAYVFADPYAARRSGAPERVPYAGASERTTGTPLLNPSTFNPSAQILGGVTSEYDRIEYLARERAYSLTLNELAQVANFVEAGFNRPPSLYNQILYRVAGPLYRTAIAEGRIINVGGVYVVAPVVGASLGVVGGFVEVRPEPLPLGTIVPQRTVPGGPSPGAVLIGPGPLTAPGGVILGVPGVLGGVNPTPTVIPPRPVLKPPPPVDPRGNVIPPGWFVDPLARVNPPDP